jgi:Tol biopolymer transport system component/serine/threonine protein kinase
MTRLTAGMRLGPYEIVEAIGAGGMGEVYRARDPRMERFVAVKILPASLAHSPERQRRFELEAKAAGSLNHPNLITVFDTGTHEGSPFIVMELLEGETLAARMERIHTFPQSPGKGSSPRLSVLKAVDHAVDIANGLAAAHDRGIIHRDLKPQNIFITRDGRVKILDFGLAKQVALADVETEGDLTESWTTSPGAVLGTLDYMSPEQLRAQPLDARTDIFSLGAILFEMLCGEKPFRGDSMADTMSAILHAHPTETRVASELAPPLRRIVNRALEKNREERFQSARDLAFALEEIGSASATQELVPSSFRRINWKRGLMLFLAGLALVVVGAILYEFWPRYAPPAPRYVLRQLTFDAGAETDPSVSPDGTAFVFASDRRGNRDVYFQRVAGGSPINLTADSPDDDGEPAFSPDGQQVAFRSERDGGGIFLMGATGESVRRLTRFGFNPSWSPDGKHLAFASEDIQSPLARTSVSQLWTVDVSSGATMKIVSGDAVQPAWSPDGKRIAYWAVQRPGSKRVLYTIPAAGGTPVALNDDPFVNWSPAWSPDSRSIYFASDRSGSTNLWRIDLDTERHAIGSPVPMTTSPQAHISPRVSRDGNRILFATYTDQARLTRIALDPTSGRFTSQPERVIGGSRAIYNGDIASDGTTLVTNSYGRQEDLFIATVGGGVTRQLTNDAFKDRLPRWSPDGSRIVFFSDRGGTYALWWIRPDGSGLDQISAAGPDGFIEPRWSPDGKKVVAYTTRAIRAATFDLTGPLPAKPAYLHELPRATGVFYVNSWSGDGKRLAGTIIRPDGSMNGIATYTFEGERFEVISETGAYPQWLGDSRTLLFGLDRQFLADADSKTVRPIGPLPGIDPAFRFLPDTRSNYVYYASRPNEGDIWMLERTP